MVIASTLWFAMFLVVGRLVVCVGLLVGLLNFGWVLGWFDLAWFWLL